MSNNTFRPLLERLGGNPANTFVGIAGEIFYDPATGNLRLSDGVTPGGLSITESSAFESEYIGPWVYFVRPPNSPEVVDEIAPNLIIARNPADEGQGSIYNAAEDDNGGVSTPYGTQWNTNGWQDLSNVTDRYYENFNSATPNGNWWAPNLEWVMHDTQNDTYWAIRFLTWDGGNNNSATGAFSYVRRQLNTSIYFNRVDTNDEETAYVEGDEIAPNLILTRTNGGAIFNWGDDGDGGHWETDWAGISGNAPYGTLWNREGWDDLSNLKSRQFLSFSDIMQNANQIGQFILGREFIMWDTLNDNYYAIKFTRWAQVTGGVTYPGFAYTRRLIDLDKLTTGLTFEDGTVQHTAYTQKAAGTLKPAPRNTSQEVDDRWINADDIGKVILLLPGGSTNTLRLPDTTTADFPIGATITIVNRTGGNVYVSKENEDENGTIYGAGTADSATSWMIPDLGGGNIATLIKIEQGMDNYFCDWLLVGSGIEVD
jgi:hypothetical protein